MTRPDTRPQFEDACWAHYRGLKARGWSHPEEGDPNSRESLFWRDENGQCGVRQIEAAWRGWLMHEVMDDGLVKATLASGNHVLHIRATPEALVWLQDRFGLSQNV